MNMIQPFNIHLGLEDELRNKYFSKRETDLARLVQYIKYQNRQGVRALALIKGK